MKPVFVDTSAIIAAASRREQHHAAAVATMEELLSKRRPLLTTNYILSECVTLARKRLGLEAAVTIGRALHTDRGTIDLIRVTEDQAREALARIESFADKVISFADATSFVVMRERGLTTAFTFDDDFRQAGFETIP